MLSLSHSLKQPAACTAAGPPRDGPKALFSRDKRGDATAHHEKGMRKRMATRVCYSTVKSVDGSYRVTGRDSRLPDTGHQS